MTYTVKEIENARVLERENDLRMKFAGSLAESVKFIERNQICEVGLWQKFVNVFRNCLDGEGNTWISWRSEFWGKMMRGASMVLKYTKNDKMYKILEDSVRDILNTEDSLGRISGYSADEEFTQWDLWGRKYVMLGLQYFTEICRDDVLSAEILASMCRQADYITEHIGDGEGKLDIRKCSRHWEGMNSCSILEPIVRLYRMTGKRKYLEFAEYIVSTGFIQSANLIELAYADETAPHTYPVVKAYEMMSCFEGLLQYYYVTGIEKYKTAVINFGRRIVDGELSIIGCCGCTHELFDHTAVRQTQTDWKGVVQETCVTVTWIKFAAALLELTGDPVFADCIEQSYYNAYVGSFNTQRVPVSRNGQNDVPQILPFDSYSPLTADIRGRQIGGYQIFSDGTIYGCCACIGAAGAGIIPQIAVMYSKSGVTLNYYEKSEITARNPSGSDLKLSVDTEYPYDGRIAISIELPAPETFSLTLRVPAWCKKAEAQINGEKTEIHRGYTSYCREWKSGDTLELTLNMEICRILPPIGAVNADIFAAYRIGPIVLAADKRITDPDTVLNVKCINGAAVGTPTYCPEIPECNVCYNLTLENGEKVRLIDYASAGKTYTDDSKTAAWLRIK